jgi:hypothetical protein
MFSYTCTIFLQYTYYYCIKKLIHNNKLTIKKKDKKLVHNKLITGYLAILTKANFS